jgi:hypothetical protein
MKYSVFKYHHNLIGYLSSTPIANGEMVDDKGNFLSKCEYKEPQYLPNTKKFASKEEAEDYVDELLKGYDEDEISDHPHICYDQEDIKALHVSCWSDQYFFITPFFKQ